MKVLVVDDELPARELLKFFLEQIEDIEIVGECDNGNDAVEFVKKQDVDAVFLDIKMYNKDGLSAATEIRNLLHPPYIVFTTGFSEYAVEAFELNAIDYVVKPYSKERLDKTVDRIKKIKGDDIYELLSKDMFYKQGKLPVWANDRLIVLNYSDIKYFKSHKKGKSKVYSTEGEFIVDLSLKDIENKFKSGRFIRTHKSYITNLEKIEQIVPWFNNTYNLVLNGCEEKIPVSRHYINKFRKLMGIDS